MPFSRRPACVLLNTAIFFFTLDLALWGEGDDDGDMETLVISLEINGLIHFTIFSSLIRVQVVVTVTIVKQEIQPLTSPRPLVSLFTFQALSSDLNNTVRIDLKKQILGVCTLPKSKVSVAQIAKFKKFVVLSKINHTIVQKYMIEICWCREPRQIPLDYALVCNVALQSFQNFLLPDKRWRVQTPTRGHPKHHRTSNSRLPKWI